MRGTRAKLPPRKARASLLVTAARYDPDSGDLIAVKAYEPRGVVWSDILLVEREEVVSRLEDGEKIRVGKNVDLATDFEPGARIRLKRLGERQLLLAEGESGDSDQLGVPKF